MKQPFLFFLPLVFMVVVMFLCHCSTSSSHYISWADITLKNYRNISGLRISKAEWKRCYEIFLTVSSSGISSSERKAKAEFCKGKYFQLAGGKLMARDSFRRAIEADPGWALPYEAMGSIELEKGNLEGARDYFSKAYQLDPQWVAPLSDLGVVYHNLGEPLKAVECLEQAIKIDPSQSYLYSNMGNILTAVARFDEATSFHLKAIAMEPHNPIYYLNLAATLEEAGELENLLWAEEKLESLLPHNQKIYCMVRRAEVLDKMGRVEEALAQLKKPFNSSPESEMVQRKIQSFYATHGLYGQLLDFIDENSPAGCKECSAMCFEIGNRLLVEENLDGALKAFELAVRFNPDWPEPYHNLGLVYYRKNNYKKAIEFFSTSLELSPDDTSSALAIAMCNYRMGNVEEAMGGVKRVIEVSPGIAITHSNLAEILSCKGKLEEAKRESSQAVSLDSSSCYIAVRHAMILLQKDGKKSRGEVLAIVERFSDCDLVHKLKAILFYAKGKYKESVEQINLYINKRGNEGEAFAIRGVIYFKIGKRKEAHKELSKAVVMERRLMNEPFCRAVVKKLGIRAE